MAKRKGSDNGVVGIPTLRLFKVVDNELVIDKDTVRGVKEFADILAKRKKIAGDADGRKKVMALKELLYVHGMADYGSIHSSFTGEEQHTRVKDDYGLPSNWRPDAEVKAAIAKYKEIILSYSYTAKILNSLERGLMMSADAVDSYIEQMQIALITSRKLINTLSETEDIETIVAMQSTNQLIQSSIKEILSLAKTVPESLKQIRGLQEQVKKEMSESEQLKGGHSKGNREDPN